MRERWTRADTATVAALVLAVLVRVAHAVVDRRAPLDHDSYLAALPRVWADLGVAPGRALAEALTEPGGWWVLGWAGLLRVAGRSIATVEAALVVQHALLLCSVAVLGRALGGPRAALPAVLLAAGLPQTVQAAGTLNVHGPEAALVLTVLAALAVNPRLQGRAAPILVALAGALAFALRPSALVPLGIVLPLVLAAAAVGPRRWPAVGVSIVWAGAAAPTLFGLYGYLGPKGAPGGGPLAAIGWMGAQMHTAIGPLGGAVVLAGLVAAIGSRRLPWTAWPVALVAAVPWVLLLAWRAGAHDFLYAAPALAALAAAGLARPWGWALSALPLAAALTAWISPTGPLRGVWSPPPPVALLDRAAPLRSWGLGALPELLDATCPRTRNPESCHVLAPFGLQEPLDRDLGAIELFLAGDDRVTLRGLADFPRKGWVSWRVDALLVVWCPGDRARWEELYADLPWQVADVTADLGLREAWSSEAGRGCAASWWTRGGELRAHVASIRPEQGWDPVALATEAQPAPKPQPGRVRPVLPSAFVDGRSPGAWVRSRTSTRP